MELGFTIMNLRITQKRIVILKIETMMVLKPNCITESIYRYPSLPPLLLLERSCELIMFSNRRSSSRKCGSKQGGGEDTVDHGSSRTAAPPPAAGPTKSSGEGQG
jgi:hypothetical protein